MKLICTHQRKFGKEKEEKKHHLPAHCPVILTSFILHFRIFLSYLKDNIIIYHIYNLLDLL